MTYDRPVGLHALPMTALSSLRTLWLLPRRALIGTVRFYQKGISPFSPPTCRFTPTCSEYAIQALQKFGFVRGTLLATWRVLRCHPLGGSGYDPPKWGKNQKDEG